MWIFPLLEWAFELLWWGAVCLYSVCFALNWRLVIRDLREFGKEVVFGFKKSPWSLVPICFFLLLFVWAFLTPNPTLCFWMEPAEIAAVDE